MDRKEYIANLKAQKDGLSLEEFLIVYCHDRLEKLTGNMADTICTDGGKRVILR